MCEKCDRLINEYYPNLSDSDKYELLMGATCFPFCRPETLKIQLEELKEKTDGTLIAALCYADEQMDEEYKKYKLEKPSEEGLGN